MIRRFHLHREEDVSGVSGTGKVAEGVEFSGGKCAIMFLSHLVGIELWDNVHAMIGVHGHNGKTKIVWDDSPEE